MPEGTNTILNQRTLQASNRRLAELLKPGMHVLDAGCGSGAITVGIAERIGPDGHVIGTDNNPRLIGEARRCYGHVPGLSFETADLYSLPYRDRFDIVNASRVLQWLSDPLLALKQMKRAAKRGGKVLVLDYNHEKIRWHPSPPESMLHFYRQFLRWRADAGMDNAVADHLEQLFRKCELAGITVTDQSERVRRGEPGFAEGIRIWAEVAASRGHQLVADGYLTEEERSRAEAEYREWAREEAEEQILYLLAVEGTKAGGETD
jgi:ubiquinone/menaquinone biosynthesis C-methylase UbiE